MNLIEYHEQLSKDITAGKIKLCEYCKGVIGDWYCDIDVLMSKPHWKDIPCFENKFNSCTCKIIKI
jgi:hypothetical protein